MIRISTFYVTKRDQLVVEKIRKALEEIPWNDCDLEVEIYGYTDKNDRVEIWLKPIASKVPYKILRVLDDVVYSYAGLTVNTFEIRNGRLILTAERCQS